MKPVALYDVTARVSMWTERGLTAGCIFGIIFGAAVAAFPPADSVLTFGAFGTIAVCIAVYASLGTLFGLLTAVLSRPAITGRARNRALILPRS